MATNVSSGPIYCDTGVDNFHTSYKQWHGYVALIVCILGTVANTLNIIVLTRREMRSPTNAILTGLAVADLAVMIEYIPYIVHDYMLVGQLPREQRLTYGWACFVRFHSIFGQVLHTISIWLTVTLAVWRYIAVGYPQKNRVWCGMRTTIITIVTAYVVCVLVVSPSVYLTSAIAEYRETLTPNDTVVDSVALSPYVIAFQREMANQSAAAAAAAAAGGALNATTEATTTTATATLAAVLDAVNPQQATSTAPSTEAAAAAASYRNVTVHRLFYSDLALRNTTLLNATFLIYSVLIKLIPCIALTILSVRLIAALLEAKRRRKLLTGAANNGLQPSAAAFGNGKPPERPRKNSKTLEKEKQTDRTTRMLLAVLLLFLITEFPQGILGLLNTVLGDPFYRQCYLRLSDLMDILALINSSINFILYCSMSRQFRSTFTLLFRPKWLPVAQQEDELMHGAAGAGGGGAGKFLGSRSAMAEQLGQATQVTNV